jgi:hypothetical protein
MITLSPLSMHASINWTSRDFSSIILSSEPSVASVVSGSSPPVVSNRSAVPWM